ncbi:FAM76A-like isoform X1 [Paramuricea clavata]|uniref:FAM76A-like isoform X1 n=1 Tax=Paramuricea clavata TaxID=317549 RepID=A0A7D9IF10_PARCT|nr:FAM76A-like isoform X1 [Paramuricea clavata]
MDKNEGAEGLFACSKCHGRFAFEELSRSEHLCKDCRQAHPTACCIYCRLEFHMTKKKEKSPVCPKCDSSLAIHGQPKCCQYCNLRAAFGGPHCNRCKSSVKKYGPPVPCEQCKLTCAFKKPDEVLKRVNGKLLCLLCTISFKRIQHRQKKANKRKHATTDSSAKEKNGAKDAKVSKKATSSDERSTPVGDNPLKQFYTSQPSETATATEQLASDHVTELTKLREELAGMKRKLQQKEQMLIEKEKQLTELKAEKWEKDKEQRQKISAIQKDNMERLKLIQEENRNLKKQISQLSKGSAKAGSS